MADDMGAAGQELRRVIGGEDAEGASGSGQFGGVRADVPGIAGDDAGRVRGPDARSGL
ncbi:hypothetical protein LUX57_43695 [Actinomadura madurae]|uniref:hypothetical protein n=1 Tax=Actinomadura madurae TaxID=1993 RepID=UPI0020D22198|nr:hypothetical protein [Actinomadura madurae]MCP9971190.1 hypothetical protein [Actinomadura madurae]